MSMTYFLPLSLFNEITALKLSHWNFPGDYIGFIPVLGVNIPIEEFTFYILIGSLGFLSYYQFFDGDKV